MFDLSFRLRLVPLGVILRSSHPTSAAIRIQRRYGNCGYQIEPLDCSISFPNGTLGLGFGMSHKKVRAFKRDDLSSFGEFMSRESFFRCIFHLRAILHVPRRASNKLSNSNE